MPLHVFCVHDWLRVVRDRDISACARPQRTSDQEAGKKPGENKGEHYFYFVVHTK